MSANLQHYNPVIDEAVTSQWDIPTNWRLHSQLVFGSSEEQASDKDFIADDERLKYSNNKQ